MEYIYATMLLHAAGKEITEENMVKVLKAPGIEVDETRVKALVSALDEIDIDEAIKSAPVLGAPAPAPVQQVEEKKEEKKEKEEKEPSEEEAIQGLGALFG
jgi:large subunit ribosomal protein L12